MHGIANSLDEAEMRRVLSLRHIRFFYVVVAFAFIQRAHACILLPLLALPVVKGSISVVPHQHLIEGGIAVSVQHNIGRAKRRKKHFHSSLHSITEAIDKQQ